MGVNTGLKPADHDQGTSARFGTFNLYNGTITECTAHGVHVFSGTFNMYDGLITGNTSQDDGAGVYVQYSDFNMTGGTISNNVAKGNGGALYVLRSEGIQVSGGSMEGNSALGTDQATGAEAGFGGAVYVSAADVVPASILICGATICGNTAATLGGGVYVDAYGVLKVSGKPCINGNTAAGKTSNVHLSAKPITVADKLEDGASVGVTLASDAFGLQTSADASSTVPVFTTGYKDKGNESDPQAYFCSDDEAYLVGWTEGVKEAPLSRPTTSWWNRRSTAP